MVSVTSEVSLSTVGVSVAVLVGASLDSAAAAGEVPGSSDSSKQSTRTNEKVAFVRFLIFSAISFVEVADR